MAGNLGVARVVQRSLDQRRQDVERIADQTPKYTVVEGLANIDGVGEGQVDVVFPILFMEEPIWGGDFALATNQTVTSFPTFDKFLVKWTTINKAGGRTYYSGARIGVLIDGDDGLKTVLHYRFSGTAFTEPTGAVSTAVGGTL